MKITNEKVKAVLQNCRVIDEEGLTGVSDVDLAKLYANLDVIKKELDTYVKVIKEELIDREIDTVIVPDIEKKVVFQEGNKKTTYDNQGIYNSLIDAGLENHFPNITNIVASKVKDSKAEVEEIVKRFTSIESGDKTVKLLKATKKELLS